MAIRLQDDKIITKDGKVSCECCETGCNLSGKNITITVTGIQGQIYGTPNPMGECSDIGGLCSGEYTGPSTITASGIGGASGYVTNDGSLMPNYYDAPITTIDAYGCDTYDSDVPICWAVFSDTQTFFETICDAGGWGFLLGAYRAIHSFAGIIVKFQGQPINGHAYAINATGNTITIPSGTITVSW